MQVGAGCLTNSTFLDMYEKLGKDCLKTDVFWKMFKVSYPQAVSDRSYLNEMLVTATMNMQHKTILKYELSQDGILAWRDLKNDFEYDSSKELRFEQLELMVSKPYNSSDPGGMAAYIDKFQSYMAELETINPLEYSDYRKKRTLVTNIRHANGVAHLIQQCRGDKDMIYDQCAAYLRENALYIDRVNQSKAPSRLMIVQDKEPESKAEGRSLEEVLTLFHTMAENSSISQVYKMFNTKSVKESLSIPEAIWSEFKPMIKEKITEIQAKVREKRKTKMESQSKSDKIPNQYPSMKNRESVVNLVSALANMSMDDVDDDTDDDVMTSLVFMARACRRTHQPSNEPPGIYYGSSQDAEPSSDSILFYLSSNPRCMLSLMVELTPVS